MEHEVVRLRFKSEALPLAIAKLNRAAFSRYELALIVWRLYESKMLNDAKVVGLSRATADLRAFKAAEDSLLQSELIKNIGKPKSPFYVWSGASEHNKFEMACCSDPFSAVSHLSAMELHGLTNRISERVFITSPSAKQWGILAQEQMEKDLGENFYRFKAIARLPVLTRINLEKIGRRPLTRYETKSHFGFVKSGPEIKVTSIGRTYLDMLREPQLCGGLQHVLDVIRDNGQRHFKLIFNEFEAHGHAIDKVRMGFLLENLCLVKNPNLDEWAMRFASRGGSRKLDPRMPYAPNFSTKWCLSINAPLEVDDDEFD